jgi:tetratricopeptide (TPR) repeat protein
MLKACRRPDAPVYFINAGTEAALKADFETIIRSRGIEYHSSSYHDAITWLATRPEDWLVIMDNADDVSFLLLPYIPQSAYGNIIVTTRSPYHALLAPKTSYQLDGLSMEDAISVILTASGYDQTEANRELACAIVRELDHLPFALAQAAGYIFVHRCLSTYLLLYWETRLLFGTRPSERRNSSVTTAIRMSLNQLPTHALNMLSLFSHLDSTWIPHAIISRAADRKFRRVERTNERDLNMQTRQQADALVEIFYVDGEWSEVDFHDLIDRCLQYSLLRLTIQGDSKFYSMHALVQSYLQGTAHMVQGHRPGPLIVRLLGSSITYSHDSKYLGFNRFLPPHLRQIQMEDVIEAGDHAGFGHVMERAGDNKSAALHLERCVEMWRESLGHVHENTLSAIVNLANSYRVIGKAQKASELEEDVLDVQERTLGTEHHDTLLTAGNLAASYIELKRYEEAMELGKQVLEARKRVLEPDADNVITMGNLAVCYANIGRNREALELEEQVLEIWNRSFGPEDPGTLRAMSNLAESYRVEGRRQEALELNQKVLEMQAKVIGPEHPDTLLPIRLQLLILRDLGMTEQVQELLQTALPAHKKVLGIDHPDTVWFRDEFGAELTPPGSL